MKSYLVLSPVAPQKFILFARRKDIRLISLDTPDWTDTVLPLYKTLSTMALAYDPVDNYIYWTDGELKSIRRAALNGSGTDMGSFPAVGE